MNQLTDALRGKTINKIEQHLISENNYYLKKTHALEKDARHDRTNDNMNRMIDKHRKLLQGGNNRLFVIAGAAHLDRDFNEALFSKEEPFMKLEPNQYKKIKQEHAESKRRFV